MQNSVTQKYVVVLIVLLFLLYSAPGALDFVFHYPDEKYYTDSVLQMIEKGDYFTPYKADGSPRFLKPILTYWILIGSYKIFGVSTFSSRIFFWLAGALLVLVTFLMVKSVTKNKKTATIAAFITASNPLVLLSCSRSIPDIFLTLFLTLSTWGFLEILLSEQRKKIHFWMAYLGAAFAFETKGLPAIAFAGISMLFLVLNPWKKVKIKQLFEPYSITAALFIAFSWFIIMYFKHGATYFESFFADQVGDRISSRTIQVLKNSALGIVNLFAFFIPWVFIAFSKPQELKSFFNTADNRIKSILGFILTWVILVIIMSGAVFKFYDRYILPVVPLISFYFAIVFMQTKTAFNKTVISILVGLNVILLLVNTLYSAFILPDTVIILGTFTGFILLSSWKLGFFKHITWETAIANGILLFYFNAFILLYPLLMPNPGKQLVNNLYNQGLRTTDKVYVYGNIRAASNLRIQSKNKLNVVTMDTVFVLPNEPNHFLVFDGKERNKLDLDNYKVFNGSEEWMRVTVEKFPGFMQRSVKNIKDRGTKYFIAKPGK